MSSYQDDMEPAPTSLGLTNRSNVAAHVANIIGSSTVKSLSQLVSGCRQYTEDAPSEKLGGIGYHLTQHTVVKGYAEIHRLT